MSNAIVKNGKIGLKSSISEYQKCKQIPGGYWSGKAKRWIYPATPATAKRIHDTFKDLSYDLDFMNLLKAADAVVRNQSLKAAENLPDVPVSFTKAWRHQKQAFWFAKDLRAAMLAMRPILPNTSICQSKRFSQLIKELPLIPNIQRLQRIRPKGGVK